MPTERWRGAGGARPGRPGPAAAAGAHAAPARRAPAQALALGRRVRGRRRWRARRARSIGGVPVAWWAVWDGERLHERMHRRAGPVRMAPGHVRAAARSTCASRRARASRSSRRTARSTSGPASRAGSRCAAPCSGRPFEGRASSTTPPATTRADTAWRWSAGVGVAESGARVAWNLVDGVHDGAERSERTVWVDGTPHHVGPLRSPTTSPRRRPALRGRGRARAPRAPAGGGLRVRDAVRALQRLAARTPGALREGWGVMERHRVRW